MLRVLVEFVVFLVLVFEVVHGRGVIADQAKMIEMKEGQLDVMAQMFARHLVLYEPTK